MPETATQVRLPAATAVEGPSRLDIRTWSWLCLVFCAALTARLWFNFLYPHVNAFAACDASEYLRDAAALMHLRDLPADAWSKCLSCLVGSASAADSQSVHLWFQSLKELHQSGSFFPLFIGCTYALCGATVDAANWWPPVLAQSVLSAVACLLISLVGIEAWNRKVGLIAGLMAAIYPAFIVNSGRLYSESFATFLTCLVLYLTVRGFSQRGNGVLAYFMTGFTLSGLQLTRSVTVILSLAAVPLVFLQQRHKRPWLSLMALLFGFALVIVPSMMLQKLAVGKMSVVVDRVGHYNFFIGSNADTSGWLSYPYPDGSGIERKSFPTMAAESFKKSPSRFLKLMLDKPLRLFKFPWNDFRTSIGPIDFKSQVAIHQIILLLAGLGISLCLFVQPGLLPPSSRQLCCRAAVIFVLLFHALYMLFITVPRYNLTAMPSAILLAAAGAWGVAALAKRYLNSVTPVAIIVAAVIVYLLSRTSIQTLMAAFPQSNPWLILSVFGLAKLLAVILLAGALYRSIGLTEGNRRAARLSSLLMTLVLIPLLAVPVRANGRWWEFAVKLERPGQTVSESITLPGAILGGLKHRQCFVMIDADGLSSLSNGVDMSVNGLKLSGPIIPGLTLLQDFGAFKHHNDEQVYLEGEYIFDSLTSGANLSNQDLRQWFLVPIPSPEVDAKRPCLTISLTKTSNRPTCIFAGSRVGGNYLEIPSPERSSWEKAFYGVENDDGLTDTRYDTKIPVAASTPLHPNGLRLLICPPGSAGNLSDKFATEQLLPSTVESVGAGAGLAAVLPQTTGKQMLIVHLSGKLNSNSSNCHPRMNLTIKGLDEKGHGLSYEIPWVPRQLSADSSFNFSFAFAPGTFPGKLQRMELIVTPGQQFKSQPVAGPETVQLEKSHCEVLRLPGNPLTSGYEIF